MEATAKQRQRLIERLFRRNYLRRKYLITPLDIELEYARGLNRILRANLNSSSINSTCPKLVEYIQKSAEIIRLHNAPTLLHDTSSKEG